MAITAFRKVHLVAHRSVQGELLAALLALRGLLARRLERLRAARLLGETRDTVSIEGWVPAQLVEAAARRRGAPASRHLSGFVP